MKKRKVLTLPQKKGIHGYRSTIHLHGEATAIHSNGIYGIFAVICKVVIHLSSHHNTSYNNGQQDRYTGSGGTITNVLYEKITFVGDKMNLSKIQKKYKFKFKPRKNVFYFFLCVCIYYTLNVRLYFFSFCNCF